MAARAGGSIRGHLSLAISRKGGEGMGKIAPATAQAARPCAMKSTVAWVGSDGGDVLYPKGGFAYQPTGCDGRRFSVATLGQPFPKIPQP